MSESPAQSLVFDLSAAALTAVPWQAWRPGVQIHRLYGDAAAGRSAALLRYAPGAEVPRHEHMGFEHIFVLAGSQRDDRGVYPAGSMVVNPPETQHRVWSPEGCVALVTWERPVSFVGEGLDG